MGARYVCLTIFVCVIFAQSSCFLFGFGTNSGIQASIANATLNTLFSDIFSLKLNTLNKSNSIHQQIGNLTGAVLGNFTEKITHLIEHSANHCAIVIQKAVNISEAAFDCAQERWDEFDILKNDTHAELHECIQNKTVEGLNIAQSLIANKLQADSLALNLTRNITNCMSSSTFDHVFFISPTSLACKLRVLGQAGLQCARISAETAINLKNAALYLATLKLDLAACGFTAFTRTAEGVATIASEIAICIADESG